MSRVGSCRRHIYHRGRRVTESRTLGPPGSAWPVAESRWNFHKASAAQKAAPARGQGTGPRRATRLRSKAKYKGCTSELQRTAAIQECCVWLLIYLFIFKANWNRNLNGNIPGVLTRA